MINKIENIGSGVPAGEIFAVLFMSKGKAFLNIHRRFSTVKEEAEDAISDFLLAFSIKVSEGRICPPDYNGYIYKAFRNFCIDRYRKNKRNIPVDFSIAWNYADEDGNESQLTCTLQAGADPSDLLHNRMVMDLMRQCIMKLRPRDRKVLLMRFMEDMKNPEIAKAIGLSTAATANVMKRAIASLRAIFMAGKIEPW